MRAMHAFAGLAAAVWMAHDGPAWLNTLDYSRFPGAHRRHVIISRAWAMRARAL
jgi:hypothetical protein